MKKPEETWEVIEREKVDLKHGYRWYPEEHVEIMDSDKKDERK